MIPSESDRNAFDPRKISRPDPSLLNYYVLVSLFAGPFFPFVFLPLYFKFKTLEYKFDDSGVSMKWGILIRKEINLTYRRIQDIHLTRNLFQRWMGLATVAVQTASGNSGPEMSIEGILESEELRNYLYVQMRGSRGESESSDSDDATTNHASRALVVLEEIRDLLKSTKRGADSP